MFLGIVVFGVILYGLLRLESMIKNFQKDMNARINAFVEARKAQVLGLLSMTGLTYIVNKLKSYRETHDSTQDSE